VIDASASDVEDRFRAIDSELAAYGAGLQERRQLVVLNKVDLVDSVPAFPVGDPRIAGVVATSTVTGAGIDELRYALFELCPSEPVAAPLVDAVPEFLDYRPRARRGPRFRSTDRGYRVVGHAPARRGAEEAPADRDKRGQVEIGDEARVAVGIRSSTLMPAMSPSHGLREAVQLAVLLVLIVADPGTSARRLLLTRGSS
jgi:hypothetical protein